MITQLKISVYLPFTIQVKQKYFYHLDLRSCFNDLPTPQVHWTRDMKILGQDENNNFPCWDSNAHQLKRPISHYKDLREVMEKWTGRQLVMLPQPGWIPMTSSWFCSSRVKGGRRGKGDSHTRICTSKQKILSIKFLPNVVEMNGNLKMLYFSLWLISGSL